VQRRNRKPGRPEAEAPQSVRPPGAENYPEPCPREKGTERRCVPGCWNQADGRILRTDGYVGGVHGLLLAPRPDDQGASGDHWQRGIRSVWIGGPALGRVRQHPGLRELSNGLGKAKACVREEVCDVKPARRRLSIPFLAFRLWSGLFVAIARLYHCPSFPLRG
jgi:hypothetical protein